MYRQRSATCVRVIHQTEAWRTRRSLAPRLFQPPVCRLALAVSSHPLQLSTPHSSSHASYPNRAMRSRPPLGFCMVGSLLVQRKQPVGLQEEMRWLAILRNKTPLTRTNVIKRRRNPHSSPSVVWCLRGTCLPLTLISCLTLLRLRGWRKL